MPWKTLSQDQVRILECARDGRPPWDCVPDVRVLIGHLNQLLELGLLEEAPPVYRLTARGAEALGE